MYIVRDWGRNLFGKILGMVGAGGGVRFLVIVYFRFVLGDVDIRVDGVEVFGEEGVKKLFGWVRVGLL